jgi:putative sterol carrier protein
MAQANRISVNSVSEVIASMPARFNPAGCRELTASYTWRLSGREQREFTIEVDRGTFRVTDGGRPDADVVFEADSDTYLRLVNGSLRGIVAIMTRKLRVRGSLQLAAKMDRIFV